jgi:hypothetical protein
MLNLLLRKDRYDLKREYSLRFLNIFLSFGIVTISIFMVLLFSINVFVWVENGIISEQLNTVSGSDNTKKREELHKEVREINKKTNILLKEGPEYSGFLSQILSAQPAGVGLNSVNFSPVMSDQDSYMRVEISAQAGLRNNMVEYANNLKNISQFENVNLPLENLTRDTNIIFKITLDTNGLNYVPEEIESNLSENDE